MLRSITIVKVKETLQSAAALQLLCRAKLIAAPTRLSQGRDPQTTRGFRQAASGAACRLKLQELALPSQELALPSQELALPSQLYQERPAV